MPDEKQQLPKLFARGTSSISVNAHKARQNGKFPREKAKQIIMERYNLDSGTADQLLDNWNKSTHEWHHEAAVDENGHPYASRVDYYPTKLAGLRKLAGLI